MAFRSIRVRGDTVTCLFYRHDLLSDKYHMNRVSDNVKVARDIVNCVTCGCQIAHCSQLER